MAFIDPDAQTAPKASVEVKGAPAEAKGFVDPDTAPAATEEKGGFFTELKKGLGEMSWKDWKEKSMIAPITEYVARSTLGGVFPGLEPVTVPEQKQVVRSASETLNALKDFLHLVLFQQIK